MQTICVIDDDETMRNFMISSLKESGFNVIGYDCGREFKLDFANHEIDLIITDIHMEGINGIELLLDMKNTNANIPVILVTGGVSDSFANTINTDLVQYLVKEMGAEILIEKPINAHKLINTINNILNAKLVQQDSKKCFEFFNSTKYKHAFYIE